MSFHTTIARLREAAHAHSPGEVPGSCRVSREDLRVALHVIDRLDADARRAGLVAYEAPDQSTPAFGADRSIRHGITRPAPPQTRNHITVVVPYVSAIGSAGEVRLLYRDDCTDKAYLSINDGHPVQKREAGASLTLDGMRRLVGGLMDCVHTIERSNRINSEGFHG